MRVRLVVRIRRTNTYGLHALLGALHQERPDRAWSVAFAPEPDDVVPAIDDGLRDADRVVVLWSFYSPSAPEAFAELNAVRDVRDDVRVTHLAGGPHAGAEPEQTLRAGFDVVAIGDGEATFVSFVDALLDDHPLADVPGLAYLDESGGYVTTGPPARHDLERYPSFATHWGRIGPIEITRGCIYSCRFCQTPYAFKARFRHRSIESVREHVEQIRGSARGRYVRFITPSAMSYGTQDETPNLDAVETLLATSREAIGPGGKVYFGSFPSEIRPEHVTPAVMRVLRRHVDNTTIIVGTQSGSARMLDAAKRGHDVDDVERAVDVALAHGFRPDVDFLFGMPGETPDDERASLDLAQRLADRGARIHAHTFMPLPGTPWRNTEPGRVSADARVDIERLTARGALYGQWERQEVTAAAIVPFVRRSRSGPQAGLGDEGGR